MSDYVFPSENDKEVQRRAHQLLEMLDRLKQWTNSSPLPPNEKDKLSFRLAKRRRAAVNVERVSLRPMTIAVFGPSQSGKSYLVNELSRGENKNLEIILHGSGRKDFLTEINPEGGRESTAQVTRFTCFDEPSPDSSFPLHIRLLSQTDLLKILVNGFSFECKANLSLDPDELYKFMNHCRSQPDRSESLFSRDDIFEVENYIFNQLNAGWFSQLQQFEYWKFFRDVVVFKSYEIQIQYISWLWARIRALTSLFEKLADIVRQVNAEDIWVHADSLIPRQESILDVENLKENLRNSSDATTRLVIRSGNTRVLPKSILAALTAELVLQIPSGNTYPFMNYADLLDFPGARARGGDFLPEDLDKPPAHSKEIDFLSEVFLRGKIAYLFDRYIELRDVNGLVLCCPPDNPEALSLPQLIQKWVKQTHGATSADRSNKQPTLFVAFTMFDTTIVWKKGGEDVSSPVRWDSRLKTGFEDFFGKAPRTMENWTTNWDTRGPFTNCCWVRNPNVDQAGGWVRTQGGGEAIREGYEEQLDEMKIHYAQNPHVKNHFADVETSWEEVARPGRPGIQYLVDRMTAGLDPSQKSQMLSRDLDNIFQQVIQICEPFVVDEAKVESAKKEGELRASQLDKQMFEKYVFGEILRHFCLSENQIEAIYEDALMRPLAVQDSAPRDNHGPCKEPMPPDNGGPRILRPSRRPRPDAQPPVPERPFNGEPQARVPHANRLSELVLRAWESHLANLENNSELSATGLGADWFRSVTDAIVTSAKADRISGDSIFTMIARRSGPALRSPDPSSYRKAQAFITHHILSNFISFLGGPPFAASEIGNRAPSAKGEGFPGENYFAEWLKRLQQLYVVNAGATVDSEEAVQANAALRELLAQSQAKLYSKAVS
jgi:hypothetical protein